MAFFLKGLGDPVTGQNEILPSFDAMIYAYLAQNAAGVCNIGQQFAITTTERGVQVAPGLAYVNGYFGMSDSPTLLNFTFPSGSAQFARVFAEVNLSVTPHRFQIRASNQSTSNNIPLIQDNLSIAASGIHQIPLYLCQINNNRTITITSQRNILNRIAHAENAVSLTGTVATAVTGVTQAAGNNSTRLATTEYADRAARDSINIISAPITTLAGAGNLGTARRQGNFVIIQMTGTSGLIPEGFRPRSAIEIGANVRLSGQSMSQWPEMWNVGGSVSGTITEEGVVTVSGGVSGQGNNSGTAVWIASPITVNAGYEITPT